MGESTLVDSSQNEHLNGDDKQTRKKKVDSDSDKPNPSFIKRAIKTGCMTLSMAGIGMASSVISPTLMDMAARLDADYGQLGWSMTSRSIGGAITCLFCGFLYDRFKAISDIMLIMGTILIGITTIFMPWSPHLYVLYGLQFISGSGTSLLKTGILTMTAAMWGKRSSGPLHISFAGVTLGLMVTPIICEPFLSPILGDNITSINVSQVTLNNQSGILESTVHVPYIIIGVLNILFGLFYVVFAFMCPILYPIKDDDEEDTKNKKKLIKLWRPSAYRSDKPVFGLIFLLLMLFAHSFLTMVLASTNFLQFTLSVEVIGLTKSLSSKLLVLIYLIETVSRLLVSGLSHCVSIQVIFMVELVGSFVFMLLVSLFGFAGPYHYWGLMYAFQLFFGPLIASVTSWTNVYINYTGIVCSAFELIAGIGMAIGFFISSWTYVTYGGQLSLYYMLGCIASMCLIIFPLQMLAHRVGDRFSKQKETVNKTAEGDVMLKKTKKK